MELSKGVGGSVAISGKTMYVGASGQNGKLPSEGAVYAFTLRGGTWKMR